MIVKFGLTWIAGIAAAALSAAIISNLNTWTGIGLPWWEASIPIILTYGFSLALAVSIIYSVTLQKWPHRVALSAAGIGITTALFGLTNVGLVAGLTIGLGNQATALLHCRWLFSHLNTSRPGTLETTSLAFSLSIGFGATWVFLESPAYAEGFMLLSWLLFGCCTLLILAFVAIALFIRSRGPGGKAHFIRLTFVWVLFASLSISAVYFMMWAEGAPPTELQPPTLWSNAFSPVPTRPSPTVTAKKAAREAPWTKDRLIKLLTDQPGKSSDLIATLGLLSGERKWAEDFRRLHIERLKKNDFTGAEDSIKYGQRDAMLFAIYYMELDRVFPGLFSDEEKQRTKQWFQRVLKDIFRTGWVDHLYAIPFRIAPSGPYLNQEIGAGAVAALAAAAEPLDPPLRATVDDFLRHRAIGWRRNFRNQDDNYHYQDTWMGSAYSLFRYADKEAAATSPGLKHAVRWIKEQIPRSSQPINYGYPAAIRPIDSLAIGAFVLGDPESRWLLDRQLDVIVRQDEQLPNELVALWLWRDDVEPRKPSPVSTLIEGPTGYTFRPGELAADKIVMRQTGPESLSGTELFALIGLRNGGWHRYPATNTLIYMERDGQAVSTELVAYKHHTWLPAGRAPHRDKKIDRSRLNGLTIARTGLDALVGGISGVYSAWRQDAPGKAEVGIWEVQDELTAALVTIPDWAGLSHERWYLLFAASRFIVVDLVSDHSDRAKLVVWNLSGPANFVAENHQFTGLIGVRLLPSTGVQIKAEPIRLKGVGYRRHRDLLPHTRLEVTSSRRQFDLISVFDFNTNPTAATRSDEKGQLMLRLDKDAEEPTILIRRTSTLEFLGIQTDAQLVMASQQDDAIRFVLLSASYVASTDAVEPTGWYFNGEPIQFTQGTRRGRLPLTGEQITTSGILTVPIPDTR